MLSLCTHLLSCYPDQHCLSASICAKMLRLPHKERAVCREYLQALLAYLESFFERTQPLTTLTKLYSPLQSFDTRWEAGQIPGWETKGAGQAPSTQIDVDAFDSVEELETIGQLLRRGPALCAHAQALPLALHACM